MVPRFTVSYHSSTELNLNFCSVLKLFSLEKKWTGCWNYTTCYVVKKTCSVKIRLFSLTDFVSQWIQRISLKSSKKDVKSKLSCLYRASGMALREFIAQKRNSKKRKFWKGNTTILQCFEIENIVTEAKFIYMFRNVTKAKIRYEIKLFQKLTP